MVKPSGLERVTRWKEPMARLQLDSITWWCNTGWAGTCSDGIIIKDIFTHRVRWKINTNQYWDGIFSDNTSWLKLDSSRLTSCTSLVDRFPYVAKWLFTSVCIISLFLGCLSGSPIHAGLLPFFPGNQVPKDFVKSHRGPNSLLQFRVCWDWWGAGFTEGKGKAQREGGKNVVWGAAPRAEWLF